MSIFFSNVFRNGQWNLENSTVLEASAFMHLLMLPKAIFAYANYTRNPLSSAVLCTHTYLYQIQHQWKHLSMMKMKTHIFITNANTYGHQHTYIQTIAGKGSYWFHLEFNSGATHWGTDKQKKTHLQSTQGKWTDLLNLFSIFERADFYSRFASSIFWI